MVKDCEHACRPFTLFCQCIRFMEATLPYLLKPRLEWCLNIFGRVLLIIASLHLVISLGAQGPGWRPGISGSSGTVIGFGTNLFQRWPGKALVRYCTSNFEKHLTYWHYWCACIPNYRVWYNTVIIYNTYINIIYCSIPKPCKSTKMIITILLGALY